MADDRSRWVTLDSGKLRCLAHPLRVRLVGALRLHGPATSAGLAARLGTNTGATSYHLRRLADVGLIEEVPDRGTARERWWAAAHDVTSWSETDFEDDPDDRAAADWLLGHQVRLLTRWIAEWIEARGSWPVAWRRASDISDMRLRLTAEETTAMTAELHEVIGRYRSLSLERLGGVDGGAGGDRPAGSSAAGTEDVLVLTQVFPTREVHT